MCCEAGRGMHAGLALENWKESKLNPEHVPNPSKPHRLARRNCGLPGRRSRGQEDHLKPTRAATMA